MTNFRKKSFDVVKISEFQFQDHEKVTFSDFDFMKQLGSGAFGQVYLARHRKNQKVYALKVLNKKRLMAKKQLKYAVS
jgi:serine/threonine protein kinase